MTRTSELSVLVSMSGNQLAFVFWLCPDVYSPNRVLTRCAIDREAIRIDASPPETIALRNITQVEVALQGSTRGTVHYVRLRANNELVELWPVNPMVPYLSRSQTARESFAMEVVINELRAGNTPNLDPNPYVRQQIADRKATPIQGLDSNISPMDYYRSGQLGPTRLQGFGFGIGVLIAFFLLALLIALILTPLLRGA